jgi:hypothetical protein
VVSLAPAAGAQPKPAAKAKPAQKSDSHLVWIIGGVVLALGLIVVVGAAVVVFKWPVGGNQLTATPSATPMSPKIPPTVTALGPTAVPPTPTAGPTSTLAPTPVATAIPKPTTHSPTVSPGETPPPEVTLTPLPECSGGRIWNGTECACPPDKPVWNGNQCVEKEKRGGGGHQ